jgi:hypothetical protein
MSQRLTRRDRALLVYVLWPAILIMLIIWAVVPLANTLAAARGALDAKHMELRTMRSDVTRAGLVAAEYAEVRSAAQQVRRRILTDHRAVAPVISLLALIERSGLSLRSVRVGDLQVLRESPRDVPVEAFVLVETTASGTYHSIQTFLRRWTGANALKLTRVDVSRDDKSGQLLVKLQLNGFVGKVPQGGR